MRILNQRASAGLLAFDLAFAWVTVSAARGMAREAELARWITVLVVLVAILAVSMAARTAYLLVRRSRSDRTRRA